MFLKSKSLFLFFLFFTIMNILWIGKIPQMLQVLKEPININTEPLFERVYRMIAF